MRSPLDAGRGWLFPLSRVAPGPAAPAPVVEKPAALPSRSPVVAARVRRPDRYDFNGEIPGVQTLDEFRSRHAKSAEQPYTVPRATRSQAWFRESSTSIC